LEETFKVSGQKPFGVNTRSFVVPVPPTGSRLSGHWRFAVERADQQLQFQLRVLKLLQGMPKSAVFS
jgi:hypothetical protein